MTTKAKVVRIIARLNVGGPARQACLLHDELSREFECSLLFGKLAEGEHDMSHLLRAERGVVRLPQLSRKIAVWSDAVTIWRLWRFLRQQRPDIVHTHTSKAGAVGRVAAWLAGVPVIVHTYHGHVFKDYFSPWKSKVFLHIERALGLLTTQVIAISQSQHYDLGYRYKVVPPEKISIVQNGFELGWSEAVDREAARQRLGIGEDDFVVAWAGRMAPIKDVPLLTQVIQRALEKKSRIFFLVVGGGADQAALRPIAECPNARILGWRDDIDQVWAAADVALLTSINEGTPTVLIEAMAAGIPFVATHVGSVQDLAVQPLLELPDQMGLQAANGFLAARTPEALLYCIEKLAADPQLAAGMASIGRAFALTRFAACRLVREMRFLYHSLLVRGSQVAVVEQADNAAAQTHDAV
jgi:glycosyltransferase involved in cell wall biosynthesis